MSIRIGDVLISGMSDNDNLSITKTTDGELQTVGVINQSDTSNALKLWTGTKLQYDAIEVKDSNTLYNIIDDVTENKVTHNIGDIFYSMRLEDTLNGAVVCDGSEYNIEDYTIGNASIKNLLDNNRLPYVSISTFDSTVTSKGVCRCFGYDGGSTFKVPKLNDVFVECGTAATPNEFIDAGLPNITGTVGTRGEEGYTSGAFSSESVSKNAGSGSNWTITKTTFDASRSSSIYGNSNTVQPNAVKYRAYVQLVSDVTESALQEIGTITNKLEETLNYGNITNCITEIPQDIKLELNDGVLTLKAGSKVYIPNGFEQDGITPKFDVVTLQSDITDNRHFNCQHHTFCDTNNNALSFFVQGTNVFSGTTAPTCTVQDNVWYDTANNVIKTSGNTGSTWTATRYALPIGITTSDSSSYTSIDQVFNGFGYIGSTVFALPGVKGLIPNGRNPDGTLANTEVTIPSLIANTLPTTYTADAYLVFNQYECGPSRKTLTTYDSISNYNYLSTGNHFNYVIAGTVSTSSGVINYLAPKNVYEALDYNDGIYISKCAMPSKNYINITLGSSGTTYTAPANGWFWIGGLTDSVSNTTRFVMRRTADRFGVSFGTQGVSTTGGWVNGILPVKTGDVIGVYYSNSTTDIGFRFVYAQGEV